MIVIRKLNLSDPSLFWWIFFFQINFGTICLGCNLLLRLRLGPKVLRKLQLRTDRLDIIVANPLAVRHLDHRRLSSSLLSRGLDLSWQLLFFFTHPQINSNIIFSCKKWDDLYRCASFLMFIKLSYAKKKVPKTILR